MLVTGGPVGAGELERAIEQAHVIVAASVVNVDPSEGPTSLASDHASRVTDLLYVAKLKVARYVYGDSAGDQLRVYFVVGRLPIARPRPNLAIGQTLLLFLQRSGDGFAITTPAGEVLRTLPELAPPPEHASRIDAVAHELEGIILYADAATEASLIVQAAEARAELRRQVDVNLLDTPELGDPAKRIAWVALALAQGQVEAFREVAVLATHALEQPAEALWSLLVQKVSAFRSAGALSHLAALMSSADLPLARAAATALRQLRDPVATPDLIRALDHSDQQVRYQAVMGLAELHPEANLGPSFERYTVTESEVLEQWKRFTSVLG
jgi:hypothetical protein